MDEVERLLNQAEPFLAEAEAKAMKATGISYLPQYMDQRLCRLIETICRRDSTRDTIARIRKDIPQDAIEAERQAGKQLGLAVELKPCRIEKRDELVEHLRRKYPNSP
jgi:hypothetical protein